MIRLVPHPAMPPRAVAGLTCTLLRHGDLLDIRYRVEASPGALLLPPPAEPRRTDGLWRSTCFELFAKGGGQGYSEFNFAPSSQWAAYRFTGRREGMAPLEMPVVPSIVWDDENPGLSARLHGIAPGPLWCGVTAVLQEKGGTVSYWALRHGGNQPDFHDPHCFVLEVPPAD
ncbi:DOMON-like domain-containing protein [Sphingomonas pokkalii]|nr:DOMON-like domain-containing protein [Sphingomonas pokkalii]